VIVRRDGLYAVDMRVRVLPHGPFDPYLRALR
jgi:hypothetical protein